MSGGGGFRGQKRKRNWDTDCPSFPGESPLQSSRVGLGTVGTAALSEAWLRCGEGFLDTSRTQLPTTEEKAATEKHLELCPRSNKETVASKSVSGLAEITWSSSGSDLSDEDKALSKSQRANEHDSKIDRFSNSDILCSEDEACEDELQFIDWEIDSDREETSEHRTVEEEEGENAVDISDSASCASSHSLTGEETLPTCPKVSTGGLRFFLRL
ncbi:DNA repair-scaffolding protein-like [Erinaceus europaeus]|uniref:DNA repair-scaffolding protein-like n=1 Tax=Erinaceus europaeus TaxID=9365 RepID=A0ABM3Y0N6_ERIEU|nr:DNA repair-scaffolding protein-like [Erinaceus europaeus]